MIPNIENRLFIEKGFGIACLAVLLTGVPSVSAQSGTDFQPLEEFQRGQREVHLAIESTAFPNPVMAGSEFNLFIQVNLPQGWHIYSLQNREDTLPTRIRLGENLFRPQGEWQESLPRITHDGVLQEMVKAHEKTAEFSRALQAPALKAWGGDGSAYAAGQSALIKRARLNGLARSGDYVPDMEVT